MIRWGILALLCVVPQVTWAETYTIDTRRYVAPECRAIAPFRYELRMGNECTASMVEGAVVTANHCLGVNGGANVYDFQSYDGNNIAAQVADAGYYDEKAPITYGGDWAVLNPVQPDDKNFVDENSAEMTGQDNVGSDGVFVMAGYGGLRVMSDEKIANFQAAYAEYLRREKRVDEYFDSTAAVNAWGVVGVDFIDDLKANGVAGSGIDYAQKYGLAYQDMVDDGRLKYSWTNANNLQLANKRMLKNFGLQAWHGDSGAGIYWYRGGRVDTDVCIFGETNTDMVNSMQLFPESPLTLIGLHVRGGADIGGARHGGRNYTDAVSVSQFNKSVSDNKYLIVDDVPELSPMDTEY